MSDTFRTHVPPHMRSIGEQTLDALLRIEELLTKLVAYKVPPSDGAIYAEVSAKLAEAQASEEKAARGSRRRL